MTNPTRTERLRWALAFGLGCILGSALMHFVFGGEVGWFSAAVVAAGSYYIGTGEATAS